MAIDDNTSYELTGSQIKDCATKIKSKADSSSLAPVATSGNYNDLDNLPTLPTVYNGKLTITQNGKTLGEFTANQSTDTTINLESSSYSTSEVKTSATWIDGKPIYKKTIDFGALPNASAKSVAHNITSIDHFVKVEGIAWTASKATVHLPFASPNQLAGAMSLLVTNIGIEISTGNDRREFANCYITLWYTKKTD